MDARIFRQLGMERSGEEAPLTHEHRLAVVLGQHLHVWADFAHARCADEDTAQRPLVVYEPEIGLEACDLPPVRVALDLDVDQPEVVAIQNDHPGTRSEHGSRE
jgi:hypothetical protein